MAANSKIAWTDDTFNPWWGCMKVGPGCDNCYAAALDKRAGGDHWGEDLPRRTKPANWAKPVKWNTEAKESGKQRKVFCASMADVFDNRVPVSWRVDLFKVIKATPHLIWIILTKRIGNVPKMLPEDWGDGYPNVWLLITTVNQEEADRDIPKLMGINAVVRGLSIEPQLEEINLTDIPMVTEGVRHRLNTLSGNGFWWDDDHETRLKLGPAMHRPPIEWVICGAESGHGARPFNENWPRTLSNQCAGRTAFFYKQNVIDGKKIETPKLDGKQYMEFPTVPDTGAAK